MSERRYRKAASCVVCDKELWEPRARWPDGPFEGEIRTPLRPLPGGRLATVVLLWSGNTSEVGLCKDCQLTPENIPEVWRAIVERDAMERDPEIRKALNKVPVPELSPDTQEFGRSIQRVMEMDPLLGVIRTRRLEEIYG